MQYGGEGDWTAADVAAHNATRPVEAQVEQLQTEVFELKRRTTPEAAWELAQQAIIQVVALKAELARERARVDVLRDLLISYGASRELHPELWQ